MAPKDKFSLYLFTLSSFLFSQQNSSLFICGQKSERKGKKESHKKEMKQKIFPFNHLLISSFANIKNYNTINTFSLLFFSSSYKTYRQGEKTEKNSPSISTLARGKWGETSALVKLISTSEQCYGITTSLLRSLKKKRGKLVIFLFLQL